MSVLAASSLPAAGSVAASSLPAAGGGSVCPPSVALHSETVKSAILVVLSVASKFAEKLQK